MPGRVLGIFNERELMCCLPNPKQLKILMVSLLLLQQTAGGDETTFEYCFEHFQYVVCECD